MIYFRELDIEFTEIQEAILEDFNPAVHPNFWNNIDNNRLQILKQMFRNLNITPKSYSLINASPFNFNIHSDACDDSVRINIPIKNCEHSTTYFYRRLNDNPPRTIPSNHKTGAMKNYNYNQEDVEIVEVLKLQKPTLINVHEPHAVGVLKKHTPRLSLTVSFEEDLEPMLNDFLL